MQSPRLSLDRSDSQSPSCCALEDSLLTLNSSTTSLRDLCMAELNDSPLSLSKIITDSDEEPEGAPEEVDDRCEDFHSSGYCLRGSRCEF
jgi:hypothetical protein